VWNLLHVKILGLRILRWLLNVWEIYVPGFLSTWNLEWGKISSHFCTVTCHPKITVTPFRSWISFLLSPYSKVTFITFCNLHSSFRKQSRIRIHAHSSVIPIFWTLLKIIKHPQFWSSTEPGPFSELQEFSTHFLSVYRNTTWTTSFSFHKYFVPNAWWLSLLHCTINAAIALTR
jgi:hypothetical protein